MNDKLLDKNARMINGPVNIIRLEGSIHGVNKVIYLFMDYHISIGSQTQCENIFSEDVQKYFANSFYELNDSDRKYDFFLEIYPTEIAKNIYKKKSREVDRRDIYIEEVVKMFKKLFRFDLKENRVLSNNFIKNIRLHYLDVRDYYETNIKSLAEMAYDIAREFMRDDYITVSGLENIIDYVEEISDHFKYITSILELEPVKKSPAKNSSAKKSSEKKSSSSKLIRPKNFELLDSKTVENIAKKLKSSYKYPDVQRIMNQLLKLTIANFKTSIKNIDENIKVFDQYIEKLRKSQNYLVKDPNSTYLYSYGLSNYTLRNIITDVVNRTDYLMVEQVTEFLARFTDIFFLRRFLDKDYITNAITYSGAMHSNTYIYYLIKYFGFKITHASYSKITDKNKLTSEIKSRNLMEIQELTLPRELGQCSSMHGFPKEFL
ncbi:hypothetical protein QLL95_gp1232 [Cotonvirus japonicus]|uniref:Uncharacterized protein n=1 Tax=Cotonvirus japonicus TaxID=2811091 RepID=A0ABM7NRW8_9VIRU|nr:hypothetical protein QLL95_gp1232 [Cotonvirus japonicus]BCS82891.1 hypothetical protein [Cotonvirus japonicus]